MTVDPREIGKMEARLDSLDRELGEVKDTIGGVQKDVRAIRDVVLQAKGSWRTLVIISGVSAAMGAFVTKIAALFHFLPRP